MPSPIPGPPPLASATVPGLVSTGPQTFAGLKTLQAGRIVGSSANSDIILDNITGAALRWTSNSIVAVDSASAYVLTSGQARIWGGLGGSAADIIVKSGTSLAEASTVAGSKLFSVRTGLGGTEVEKFYVKQVVSYGPSSALGLMPNWEFRNTAGEALSISSVTPAVDYLVFNSGVSNTYNGTRHVFTANNGAGATDICIKAGMTLADASVNAGAKLLSLLTGIGGTEVEKFSIGKSGSLITIADQSIPVGVGSSSALINIAQGLWYDSVNADLGIYNLNGAVFLGINVGTGAARASGLFSAPAFGGTPQMVLQATNGGGASDICIKAGTAVADASVNGDAKLFSLRTGINGTETEWAWFKRPVSFGGSIMTIDQKNETNTYALTILNTGAGVAGIRMRSFWGAEYNLQPGQPGAPGLVATVNEGLEFSQNSNAYDTTTLMRFKVQTSAGMAASIPAFDFDHIEATNVGQLLARWRANGTERFSIAGDGVVRVTNTIRRDGQPLTLQSDRGAVANDPVVDIKTTLNSAGLSIDNVLTRIGSADNTVVEVIDPNADYGGTVKLGTVLVYSRGRTNRPALFLRPEGFCGPGFADGIALGLESWGGGQYIGSVSNYELALSAVNRGARIYANGSLYLPWPDSPHVFIRSQQAGPNRPQVVLQGDQAGATDRCVTVGTSVADASVDAAARLFSVRTELAGQGGVVANEREKFAVLGNGDVTFSGFLRGQSSGPGFIDIDDAAGTRVIYNGNGLTAASTDIDLGAAGTVTVRSVGARPRIYTDIGSAAADVGTTIGFNRTDASTDLDAKLFTVATDVIGATPVPYFNVTRRQVTVGSNTFSIQYLRIASSSGDILLGNTNGQFTFENPTGGVYARINGVAPAQGRMDIKGTDSSGTPGNATINAPSGISAVASGATSVTITNSVASAGSRVTITLYADPGASASRWWVTRSAGSFTLNFNGAVGANIPFGWECNNLI